MIYLIDDAKAILENDEKKIEAIKRQMIIEDYELQMRIAKNEGKIEGKQETQIESVLSLLDYGMSSEQIAKALKLEPTFVEDVIKSKN